MEPVVLVEQTDKGILLQAVLGDLTCEDVDAIVNAANSNLVHAGGLAGAIVDRGGMTIQLESSEVAPVAVGGAAITTAGDLPARWVIHAVGPVWGSGDEENLLRSAVRSALDRALELEAKSLALPGISTGIFGYPKDVGTQVIVHEVRRYLGSQENSTLQQVRFTASDNETAELFADALCRPPR